MNRLANETSPYLLQHAANPVDWYPWGDEALARARLREPADLALDRLRGLPLVPRDGARVVRGRGDGARDERAVRLREGRPRGTPGPRLGLHGRGRRADRQRRLADDGVPDARRRAVLRRHVLPAGAAPRAAGVPAGAARGVGSVGDPQRRGAAARARTSPSTSVRAHCSPPPTDPLTPELLDAAQENLRAVFDPTWGGFGRAPKFPPAPVLEFLLRRGEEEMTRRTLDAMAAGGMHDLVGGGFHRYSVDARWLVPHFEKMLYDNALLASVYLHAARRFGDDGYRTIAEPDARLPRARARSRRWRLRLGAGRRHRRCRRADVHVGTGRRRAGRALRAVRARPVRPPRRARRRRACAPARDSRAAAAAAPRRQGDRVVERPRARGVLAGGPRRAPQFASRSSCSARCRRPTGVFTARGATVSPRERATWRTTPTSCTG